MKSPVSKQSVKQTHPPSQSTGSALRVVRLFQRRTGPGSAHIDRNRRLPGNPPGNQPRFGLWRSVRACSPRSPVLEEPDYPDGHGANIKKSNKVPKDGNNIRRIITNMAHPPHPLRHPWGLFTKHELHLSPTRQSGHTLAPQVAHT